MKRKPLRPRRSSAIRACELSNPGELIQWDCLIMPRYPPGKSRGFPDDARQFYRVATQRIEEARFLFDGERYAASIYLARYSVECGLKALILGTESKKSRADLAAKFRGSVWHNLSFLLEESIRCGVPRPTKSTTIDLTFVHDEWSVDLRYLTGEKRFREAQRFVSSTDRILHWVKGSL